MRRRAGDTLFCGCANSSLRALVPVSSGILTFAQAWGSWAALGMNHADANHLGQSIQRYSDTFVQ